MQRRQTGEQARERPAQIGRYPVEGELGRGGMGVVYLARDPILDRPIAIKILPPTTSVDEQRTERFVHEAKVLASLNHPNIATIYSLEESGDRFFLALELIEGDTLEERIANHPLPVAEAISVGSQIARALEAAHERGIVHRDLKPANVKITRDGLAKVLDFGIAKVIASDSDKRIADATQDGMLGTPGYMSPEQINGKTVDHQTDIWAFGCILYECLTGAHAFGGRNLFEVMFRTMEREPDWDALPAQLPESTVSLLKSCLVKQAEKRPESIVAVRRQLDELIVSSAGPIAWQVPAALDATGQIDLPHNLPLQLTAFIGRERQLHDIEELIASHRMVTLTGAGGCGKSRLALEAARRTLQRFPAGVWLVELAPISDPAAALQAIAAALGLREEQGKTVQDTLVEYLAGRELLLLLDNCEHLLEASAELAGELLLAAPALRILTTSREALAVDGERIYPVPSMEVPGISASVPETAMEVEAVRLFIDRATAALHGYTLTPERCAAIAEICRRLDGIPLAIEIAAASVKVLPVEELASRLDHCLRVLTRGSKTAPARQRTLRATIEWSHELLTGKERTVFRRLSIFAGGWTLGAAEQVCSGEPIEAWEVLDLFARLVDKSLVEMDVERSEQVGRGRYRMLETIREYGLEQLERAGETAMVRARHLGYFRELVQDAARHASDAEQAEWLRRLDHDYDNLRSGIEGWLEGEVAGDQGEQLTGTIGWYWDVRGLWSEGRRYCESALEHGTTDESTAPRADLFYWAGELARLMGDLDHARSRIEASLGIRRQLGMDLDIATCLNNLANIAFMRREFDQARSYWEESLAIRQSGADLAGTAVSLNNLGTLAWAQSDFEIAQSRFTQSLDLRRQLGDQRGIAIAVTNLGNIALGNGQYDQAREHLDEAEGIYRAIGDEAGLARALSIHGAVAFRIGDYAAARTMIEECLQIRRRHNDRAGIALAAQTLGNLFHIQEDLELAKLHYEECIALWREVDESRRLPLALTSLGELDRERGDFDSARLHLGEALDELRTQGDEAACAAALRSLAYLDESCENPESALVLLSAAEAMRERAQDALHPDDEQERDRVLAEIHSRIGEVAFERETAKGRSLSLEDAVALAISRTATSPRRGQIR